MELEQELRDILHRDAADLILDGPGPDDARRRAFRRKRRMQSGVVIVSAAGLVGGTLAVIETRDPSHGPVPRIETQPIVPTSDLVWRTADGTVLVMGKQFTTAAGVTYALSTAPGSKPSTGAVPSPQELYSTRDGVTWTHASLGASPWVVDLAESKGVLYAVGTGPGAQADTVSYKLATSTDGGAQWTDTPLPVDFTAPQSAVPLSPSRSVHVARNDNTTVAIARASYSADVSKVLGSEVPYNETAGGVQILGRQTCKPVTGVTSAPSGSAPQACGMEVTATRPWSDFGISDPAALHQQQALVRTDGGDWSKVDVPIEPDSWVTGVTATSTGFLMVEQLPALNGAAQAKLLSSTDGRTWAPVANTPRFDSVSISGDRIIGIDSTTADLFVSNDAGATWIATQNVGSVLPSGTALEANTATAYAGPLGYAALTLSGGDGRTQHTYLLHSSDGTTWKVTDLGAAGAPAGGQVSGVSVGADHIDVSYTVAVGKLSDGAPASYKLVELLGTPKASTP